MRGRGQAWTEIAGALQIRFEVNCRAAMRMAHGWSQREAAERWNTRWPDEPKTFKSISYWETWPSPTGYEPSLGVLARLAELYECDAADLVTDVGQHRAADPNSAAPQDSASALHAWQLQSLDMSELTRYVGDVSSTLPTGERRAQLLKLSAAAAAAAPTERPAGRGPRGGAPTARELAGPWDSRYTFVSTGRGAELVGEHHIVLRPEGDRLLGTSLTTSAGTIALDLSIEGLLVSGAWVDRTDPSGYYRGAVYHGVVQFVLDPTGRSMTGKWLGPDKSFHIDSGDWVLTRANAGPSPR